MGAWTIRGRDEEVCGVSTLCVFGDWGVSVDNRGVHRMGIVARRTKNVRVGRVVVRQGNRRAVPVGNNIGRAVVIGKGLVVRRRQLRHIMIPVISSGMLANCEDAGSVVWNELW